MKTHTKSERFLIVHVDEDIKLITSRIERLYVKNGVFRMKGVDDWGFGELPALEELVIGNECFPFVRDFRLVGLKNLKKLEIGKTSFLSCGAFCLEDCPALKSISIGSLKYADLQRGFPAASLELRSMVGWSVINRLAEAAKRAAGRLGVRHCEACGV